MDSIRVVSAEIQRESRYLITQRTPKAVLPLLWEFPGGRVREDETDSAALTRTLRMRLGIEVEVGEKLMEIEHTYPDYVLTLAVYRCRIAGAEPSAEPRAIAVNALAWVAPEEFADYPFPGADQTTVDALLRAEDGWT